jgi:hypothetical protein
MILAAMNLYSSLQYLVLAIGRKAGQLAILCSHWGKEIQDIGYELLRIILPRLYEKWSSGGSSVL